MTQDMSWNGILLNAVVCAYVCVGACEFVIFLFARYFGNEMDSEHTRVLSPTHPGLT